MTGADQDRLPQPFAVVGAGRVGTAVVKAMQEIGLPVSGPHGRGYTGRDSDGHNDAAVLVCVPDDAIPAAAAAIVPGPLIGHCSGVSGLDVLGAREGFSVHPLMTVTHDGADFTGVWAAISGSSARALRTATALADALGLRPVEVDESDRAAYHAAASFAANFLVTVESAAAELLSTAGLNREILVPLARAALENWSRSGSSALTGPVARGDIRTVERHREVVASRTPELLELFDALVGATQRVAAANASTTGVVDADRIGPETIGSAEPTVPTHDQPAME